MGQTDRYIFSCVIPNDISFSSWCLFLPITFATSLFSKTPKTPRRSLYIHHYNSTHIVIPMSARTPLEVWNRAVHSYESIPEDPVVPRRHSWYPSGRLLVSAITAVGLCCLGLFAWFGSYMTVDKAHQEAVVPTLLSIMDPATNTHLYALRNPLYEQFQQAQIIKVESSIWKSAELPELWLDKTHIHPGESVTITWTVGRDAQSRNIVLKEADVIAFYCDEARTFLEVATIAQAQATSKFNGGSRDSWFIPSFPNLRQDSCHFRLYLSLSTKDQELSSHQYVHVATTQPLKIQHAKETPTSIHLALGNETSRMTIQFTTGDVADTVPIARIKDNDQGWHTTVTGTTDTYTSQDMCQSPGNLTQAGNFYPPGMLHTITLENLKPNTEYRYQVGLLHTDKVLIWSEEFIFRTAPNEEDNSPLVYVVYGDQGCPYHGWKGGQEWIETMLHRETNLTSVHHFGDISYARGAAHVWDSWFDMVQPLTSRVPLMVAIGNHEYDHTDGGGLGKDPSGVETPHGFMPSWGNFGEDSGGECGVPTAKRFQMPTSTHSNGVFWYSFDYGIVHTVVISSEHDLSPGSAQYVFLEHDLENVDRSKTPWVVLESHRPLYEGEGSGSWWSQNLVGQAMRDEFEDLLLAYQVDLVLAGHYHEYQRTCDGLYKTQCDKGGPIHITVGSAGAKLDDGFELVNHWTNHFIKGEFGYGRITVANCTDMHFEFVRHGTKIQDDGGKVLDDVWIHRDR